MPADLPPLSDEERGELRANLEYWADQGRDEVAVGVDTLERLLAEHGAMAARVRELEALEAALRERAQEVRRAWDAVCAAPWSFERRAREESLKAAIDRLCPPVEERADASRAPGAGEGTA